MPSASTSRLRAVLVRRQRVGLPSGAVEGDHQLSRERLAVGMLCRQLLQLGDELAVASEHQVGLDPILDRREPELVETVGLAPRPLLVGEVGEGAAPPQRECLAETCARLLRSQLPERLSAFRGELLEARDVEVSGVQIEHVAGALPVDAQLPEQSCRARIRRRFET